MTLRGEPLKVTEDGEEKAGFVVTFTNGALAQLEALKTFLGAEDPIEVIKVGIAFIQGVKERQQNKEKPDDSKPA